MVTFLNYFSRAYEERDVDSDNATSGHIRSKVMRKWHSNPKRSGKKAGRAHLLTVQRQLLRLLPIPAQTSLKKRLVFRQEEARTRVQTKPLKNERSEKHTFWSIFVQNGLAERPYAEA